MLTASMYVGGYFWLSTPFEAGSTFGKAITIRFYKYEWLAEVYRPMAKLESQGTNAYVSTMGDWPRR